MSGASEWAAWAALGLSLILLGVLVGVVVLGLRFWRKVEPTVTPMLSMFGAAPLEQLGDVTLEREPPA